MSIILDKVCEYPEVSVLLEIMKLSNSETYLHSISVAKYVEMIVNIDNGWTDEQKEQIVIGALLHDIGKIFVPLNLTQLPRTLTPQEFDIIKVHASVSYEIVRNTFSIIVQNICLYHHEKPNGKGYMNKMPLCSIPDEALLVQVADVYDALTSTRAYKVKYEPQKAIDIMEADAIKLILDDRYVNKLKKCLIKKGDIKI